MQSHGHAEVHPQIWIVEYGDKEAAHDEPDESPVETPAQLFSESSVLAELSRKCPRPRVQPEGADEQVAENGEPGVPEFGERLNEEIVRQLDALSTLQSAAP